LVFILIKKREVEYNLTDFKKKLSPLLLGIPEWGMTMVEEKGELVKV